MNCLVLPLPISTSIGESVFLATITTIGFDIAKSVFQVHGVDATGRVVIRRAASDVGVVLKPPPMCRSSRPCSCSVPRFFSPSR
jgi:hypothetical protein